MKTKQTINIYHDLRLPAREAWQGSEHALQVRIMLRCSMISGMYPEIELLHAIPNGGKRHLGTAKKLKAEGAKSGIPDLFLPVKKEYSGLYIELKKAGGVPSENQKWWLNNLSQQGYFCAVANDEEITMNIIECYLCGKIEKIIKYSKNKYRQIKKSE